MYDVERLYQPKSLDEALAILAEDPAALPLAGGTDVIVKLRKNHPTGVRLISLDRIEDLKGVEKYDDGTVAIGAMTTFTRLAQSPVISETYPMLATAALSMGGPQIQNVATIGGNVCNGAVSADSAPSLFALDARLVLRTRESERIIPISEFYLGPSRVDRHEGELLIKILIPAKGSSFGGIYTKFSVRKAMDLAILGAAGTCELAQDGTIGRAAIALGVAAPVPIRCPEAEAYLIGKIPTEEVLKECGRLALSSAKPRDSWRASKRYREALIRELSGRVIREAFILAGGKCDG